MSINPRLSVHTSIHNVSVSHRGCQVIHDSLPCNKSQITRPLYFNTLLDIYNKNNNLAQRFEYADQRMPIAITQGSDKNLRNLSNLRDHNLRDHNLRGHNLSNLRGQSPP